MNIYEIAANKIDNFYLCNKEEILAKRLFNEEELEQKYVDFQERFSPEVLACIPKEELLEIVFDDSKPSDYLENPQKSMIFTLLSENAAEYGDFGHIGTQHHNNLPLRRSGSGWKLGRGFHEGDCFLTKTDALEKAYKIRNAMVSALRGLTEDSLITLEDYRGISERLNKKIELIPAAWFHKYLHLLFPNSFSQFHTIDYKTVFLNVMDIKPISKNQLDLAWQINEVYKNSGIKDSYSFAQTIYAIKGFTDLIIRDNDDIEAVKKNLINGILNPVNKSPKKSTKPKTKVNQITVIKEPYQPSDDADYVDAVTNVIAEQSPVARPEISKEPVLKILNGVKKYIHNPYVAAYALQKSGYKCEYNCEHETFTRRTDGNPYTEPHHIIPISQQPNFPEHSLDVPENIISLCSHCHKKIHYATPEEQQEMLFKIFLMRKDQLEEAGILIDLKTLFEIYS